MEIFFAFLQKESEHIVNNIFTVLGAVFLKHRNTLYKLHMQNSGNTQNPKGERVRDYQVSPSNLFFS